MIEFIGIRSPGNIAAERVVFRVTKSGDVGGQIVFRTRSYINREEKKRKVVARIANAFWFPDKQIDEGDLIILYSKSGFMKDKVNENGKRSHFFYWELEAGIWGAGDHALVVGTFSDWESHFLDGDTIDDIEP